MRAIMTGMIIGSIMAAATPVWAHPLHPMEHRTQLFRAAPHRHFIFSQRNRGTAPNFNHRNGAQFAYPFDYFGGDLGYEAASQPAPAVVVAEPSAPPAAAPVTSERDERATVETTPSGVTVVRGPGSRHIAP